MGSNTSLHPVLLYSDLDSFCSVYTISKVTKKTPGVICMACFSHEEKSVLVIRELMCLRSRVEQNTDDNLNFFKSTFLET